MATALADGARYTDERGAAGSLFQLIHRVPRPAVLDLEAAALALCGALPPGRSLGRGVLRVRAPIPAPVPVPATLRSCARGLLQRLQAATQRAAPPPRCDAALSGGIDSATLVALLTRAGRDVTAWSVLDDFADDGEIERARSTARAAGVARHEVIVVPERELPDAFERAVLACEDVIHNGRAVASTLFFERLRTRGVRHVVSGVGADEVLAGNPGAATRWRRTVRAEAVIAQLLLTPAAAARARSPRLPRQRVPALLGRVLPDLTLPPEIRASAAAGIVVALPYLDPRVARFGLGLPRALNVRGGFGKRVLREATAGLVPDAVRWHPKVARVAPAGGRDPRARARWLALYDALLTHDRLEALPFLDARAVRRLVDRSSRLDVHDPARIQTDAVLMRTASLTVLEQAIRSSGRVLAKGA